MEYNHSVAQSQKYLALKNIVPFEESKDNWDKITAFNAYQTLAILELRVLIIKLFRQVFSIIFKHYHG